MLIKIIDYLVTLLTDNLLDSNINKSTYFFMLLLRLQ